MTNALLEIKYKTQKQLHEEAQHDIGKYIENSHRIVREVEAQYGVKFTYGARQGGEVEPLIAPIWKRNGRQGTCDAR
jgi:hypothetical protein